MTKRLLPLPLLALGLLALVVSAAPADEVKMKSGETHVGRITYEAEDMVKIEVTISASIKETKILARADIESISKDSPDDVEFNRVQSLVPVPSLLQAENYRQLLATGPDSFLKAFPDSEHVPKVQEIRATLAEELDKVERGYLKIEEDWISPQDKIDFKEIVDSRIRLLRMESFSKGGNYASLIAAMREFEAIEKSYQGVPAYAKAVELARQVVPALGRQLQTLSRDVEYLNAEYQRNLDASNPEAKQQLIAARAREDKAVADSVAADKKAGVKWVQLNARSKPAIDDYLKTAAAELTRIQAIDTATLAKQGELLYEADKLIAANDLSGARTKIAEAAAVTGEKVEAGAKAKSSSKSKSKGSAGSGSYLAVLNGKINERLADEAAKAKERAAAAKSQALTANLTKSGSTPDSATDPTEADVETETSEDDDAAEKPAPPVDEFAALSSPQKKGETKAAEKTKTTSKTKAKSSQPRDDDEDEDDAPKKPRPAAVEDEEEGGFSLGLIVPILTALLILTVVVLKVLGIGGKKEE